jgi:NAD(P)-dependent dehydrogenase (short-subunit alcohol dehydrogenase family)
MSAQKIALITGCSRGLGLGLVQEYIGRGYRVIATCRSPEKATLLKNLLSQHGQDDALPLNVADVASIKACHSLVVAQAVAHLDVLVNNAGISNKDHPDDLATSTNPVEFNQIMNTNVTGAMVLTQTFLPLLLKSTDEPRVINISSGLGSKTASPRFTTTSYQCSKAALNMLTKCFADEVKEVAFVAIHPGWVQTDMGSCNNRKPPVSVEDSAKGVVSVAHGLAADKSGTFIGFDGQVIPY